MRSYGQYCGLAKALDHIGDRWTLLIVRELLVAPRRYSQIRAALPGIASNLLADRLRGLTADGVVARDQEGRYQLTEFGRQLESVILDLVRWGGRWMRARPDSEVFRAEWLVVALKALLMRESSGRLEIRVDGTSISVEGGEVHVGEVLSPDAVVEGPPDAILGVAAGELPLSAVNVTGDAKVVAAVLRPAAVTKSEMG
jgi:DNA-binding HxlR family transcriptional regulator